MLLTSIGTILVDRVQKKNLRTLIHDKDSYLVPQASLISFPVLAFPFKFLHFAFCQVMIHLFLYCHMISPHLIVLLPQSSRNPPFSPTSKPFYHSSLSPSLQLHCSSFLPSLPFTFFFPYYYLFLILFLLLLLQLILSALLSNPLTVL